jgi:hypothetical protein
MNRFELYKTFVVGTRVNRHKLKRLTPYMRYLFFQIELFKEGQLFARNFI